MNTARLQRCFPVPPRHQCVFQKTVFVEIFLHVCCKHLTRVMNTATILEQTPNLSFPAEIHLVLDSDWVLPSRGLRPDDSYQGLFGSFRVSTHFYHTFFPGVIRADLTTFILTLNSSSSCTSLAFLFRISCESSFFTHPFSADVGGLENIGILTVHNRS